MSVSRSRAAISVSAAAASSSAAGAAGNSHTSGTLSLQVVAARGDGSRFSLWPPTEPHTV